MMDKRSLSIHRRKILASGVLVAVLASLVLVPYFASTAAGGGAALFEFRAKWICNLPDAAGNIFPNAAESMGLVPGEYKTDINVHNPSHSVTLNPIVKKFVISVPETHAGVSPFTAFVRTILPPDGAFFIDCFEITQLLGIPPGVAAKGFVVIGALSSAGTPTGFSSPNSLDVVAEYSAESFAPTTATPTNGCFVGGTSPVPCSSTGLSLDVERIPAAPFVP